MMPAIIFAISLVTLFMFFVSYCRSLMASSAQHSLSVEVRDVTGILTTAKSADFTRVSQLLQLCPERPQDRAGLKAVSTYFEFLGMADSLASRLLPTFHAWLENERASCAYFAAVVLDRRISFNREMLISGHDA